MAPASGRGRGSRRRGAGEGEHVFDGLGVSPGVAIGPAYLHEAGRLSIPEFTLKPEQVEAERARFRAAVEKSLRQLSRLRSKGSSLPGSASEELGFMLDAHVHMLSNSRLLRGAERRIVELRTNAEAAVQSEIAAIVEGFAAIEDSYIAARAQDVRDVGVRLIRNLTKTPFQAFSNLAKGSLVIADEITPADTALMDATRIGGFATEQGGAEGHTAIMARSMGLPAVLGAAGLTDEVHAGDQVIIDGSRGKIIARPTAATLEAYAKRREDYERAERSLVRLARLPAVTTDAVEIKLEANIELPREVEAVRSVGAAGIGLFRSEFMFMNRDDVPDEDEQYEAIAGVVKAMDGKVVTVRTLDVGGEKLASALGDKASPSPNPALGLRAIRLSLKQPELLEPQLAAILRAGALGPVRILLPMIATPEEVTETRRILARVARRLVRKGTAIADPMPPVGGMIEVPGAALAADALARVCDFFAIGTNDLTMYTLAIDRGDERVAHLYNPLHPAVLRLIQFTTGAALRNRIPVSLCGEMAGDPRYTGLLIGLGIRELSMAAIALPRVKERVRAISFAAATTRAQAIMDQSDMARISALLDEFNAQAVG
jgi:phosphoenolpyruvate-protein phosphotransferase (PTS system enzyme I)